MNETQESYTILEWLLAATPQDIARLYERVVDPRDQARIIEA